ncbi:ImmA/IrrE family metallo-endopeptidase [Cronobacter turicensis]|nr:ImmA/IrrE family metallo-endopeptidase [Cronobacter turicensis]
MADLAYINPNIITWAQARARVSEEDLSRATGAKIEKVLSWIRGIDKPTFSQAQKIAGRLYIPFAYLFLPEPPQELLPLPDLRTLGNRGVREDISVDLKDTIFTVLRRQEWYKAYLQDQDASPLQFVGSVNLRTNPKDVATVMKNELGISGLDPAGMSWEEYQRTIINAAEAAGILVMRSGIVDNNTHRPLNINEFRGFAISDPLAPIVFINLKDAPSARLFTLIHELAHLWIGESGISSASVNEELHVEKYCNQVAGEFLAPEASVIRLWSDQKDLEANVAYLAKYFHVSRYVIIRRAYDLGLVTYEAYQDYYRALIRQFNENEGGGGNFYATAQNKNSARFSKALLDEALSGRVLLRDAGKLLGVSPNKLKKFATEIGA